MTSSMCAAVFRFSVTCYGLMCSSKSGSKYLWYGVYGSCAEEREENKNTEQEWGENQTGR